MRNYIYSISLLLVLSAGQGYAETQRDVLERSCSTQTFSSDAWLSIYSSMLDVEIEVRGDFEADEVSAINRYGLWVEMNSLLLGLSVDWSNENASDVVVDERLLIMADVVECLYPSSADLHALESVVNKQAEVGKLPEGSELERVFVHLGNCEYLHRPEIVRNVFSNARQYADRRTAWVHYMGESWENC